MLMSSEMFQAVELLTSNLEQSDSNTCRHTDILTTTIEVMFPQSWPQQYSIFCRCTGICKYATYQLHLK
jgi:hypothetical protein